MIDILEPLKVYIGWDSRYPQVADVCRYSLQAYSSIPLEIVYLRRQDLIKRRLLKRQSLPQDESVYNKYYVPFLNNFEGKALYIDSSFMFCDDVGKLLDETENTNRAVYTVESKTNPIKFAGKKPVNSSLILFNCDHVANSSLTPDKINTLKSNELKEFNWLPNSEIGRLTYHWSWDESKYKLNTDSAPKAVYFPNYAGPWQEKYNGKFKDRWFYLKELTKGKKSDPVVLPEQITASDKLSQLVQDIFAIRVDPWGLFSNIDIENIKNQIETKHNPQIIAVLDGAEEEDNEQPCEEPVLKNDKILENFVIGANGAVGTMGILATTPTSVPVVLRGITKRKVMRRCEQEGRDYYYVDTGYFGNDKKKDFHRITKNAMQYFGGLNSSCSDDRFLNTRTTIKKHTTGTNILICPPSQKAMKYWGLNLQEWMDQTVQEIKKHTDRPIVIREKQPRSVRVNEDTMEMALSDDVHCMVTFNSIAAVESLINGKPVYTMGPNAAQPLANTDLSTIEQPWMPDYDQVRNLCCNLAYHQFTVHEMRTGQAWKMLKSYA